MKIKALSGFAVVMIAALAGGAYWFFVANVVDGSGVALEESRDLESFHQIQLSCAGGVDVSVGATQSVTITGDDNIVPLITTEVSEGRLTIDCEKRFRSELGIKFKVTVLNLDSLVLSGSGDIQSGAIEGESLNTEVSGSGKIKVASYSGADCTSRIGGSGSIEIGTLVGEKLSAKISGSGSMTILGKVSVLDAKISGSGHLNLKDLATERAEVRVSGSGNMGVRVDDVLEGAISGSGNIAQHGKAKPLVKVSGSGRVTQK